MMKNCAKYINFYLTLFKFSFFFLSLSQKKQHNQLSSAASEYLQTYQTTLLLLLTVDI